MRQIRGVRHSRLPLETFAGGKDTVICHIPKPKHPLNDKAWNQMGLWLFYPLPSW